MRDYIFKVVRVAFLSLFAISMQAQVEINETNFPDETFRSMITSLPEGQDGVLTDEEICKITYLSLKGDVTNAKGIEYLTSLTMLDCNYCSVTELDLTANTALEIIRMELVPLETMNVTGLCSLKYLICQRTLLSKLDVSMCKNLQYLFVNEGCLTSLDLSGNTNLRELNCRSNHLTSLNLSDNINLEKLDCSGNQLTSLVLPQSETLTEMKCFANHLSAEHMDILVASLPTVSEGSFYPYIEVADVEEEGPQTEFNVCTTNQVETAKSKGWTVYGIYHITSGYWEEYAGSSTTGINGLTRQEPPASRYSISGTPLRTDSPYKGIVIKDGRKVVLK